VSPHHSATFQEAAALGERARQPRWTRIRDGVRLGGSTDWHFLRHHCLLVDIMHVRQVAAEGCGLHHLPTLETLDIPGVPLSRSDTATLQTPVRISRELGPDPTRGADHRLRLGHVCLKPHCKKTHEKIQRRLQRRRLQKRLTSARPTPIPRSLLLSAAPGTTRVQQHGP
jgi:hypothetical protein